MRQKHFIDIHKGVTFVPVLLLMAIYDQWQNPTAWLYLALHGTYGILWVVKSRTFGDRQWQRKISIWFGLANWGALTLYWIAPWLLMSRQIEAPPWYLGLCATLYGFGVFFHFASDMQKHVALQYRPGLVQDGLWSRCRNPNYFGELLIYLSFGLLAMHWLPLLVIALFITFVWYPNMRRKDRSLARYPEFAEWESATSLFIPFLL
jgi:steroid 5-alpha reductase family enzyme